MPHFPIPRLPLSICGVTMTWLVGSWFAARAGSTAAELSLGLSQIVAISIVIWQACDPFADAAQWLGARWRIPGSVRGATLDAVASSLPELFTGLFFVVLALTTSDTVSEKVAASREGLGATVATCAGSAVYNMMLIPAFCGLVIAATRKEHPTIDVEPAVITRDGLWFLGCEVVLLAFLYQDEMHWWMAVVLLAMYGLYVLQLIRDGIAFRYARKVVDEELSRADDPSTDDFIAVLKSKNIRPSLALISQLRDEQEDTDEEQHAGVLFGMFELRLSMLTAIGIISVSTIIAAAACYWLVEVTRHLSATLNVPLFFVAVILAAAASSVPDTFLSIAAARRGDDDGAVSNAFGSNIFDICVCLALPLLVALWLNGWEPIGLTKDGQPMTGLVGLRILLCVLTVVTLLLLWQNLQLTARKSWVLVAMYLIFVGYAVAGSLELLPSWLG